MTQMRKKYANHFGVQTIITIIEATVIKFVYETSYPAKIDAFVEEFDYT